MQEIQCQNNALPSEYVKLKESNKCAVSNRASIFMLLKRKQDASDGKQVRYCNQCYKLTYSSITNRGKLNEIFQKNFLHGVQNARNILTSLEHSIEKSSTYEDKLLRCRTSHKHSHDFNDWPWDTDFSDDKDFKGTQPKSDECLIKSKKSSQQQNPSVNLIESWSTMSMVCLQYQYEELSKRYEVLLKSYNDKCSVVNAKNQTIAHLRQRARVMHAQLTSAHKTLLCVGEKYLALKKRRHEQLQQYDKKIDFLKSRMREVLATSESARLHMDQKLSQCMHLEQNSEYATLLAEMKKCNQLYMENLKLKAQLEEYLPSSVKWNI